MVNGGKREGAGRKAGSIGFSTQQQIKRLNAILTFEQYKEIVLRRDKEKTIADLLEDNE